jgi:CBS domain-containing protein
MKALDVMACDVVTIAPDDTVAETVRRLTEHDVSIVDINDNVVGDTMRKQGELARWPLPFSSIDHHAPHSQANLHASI